MITDKIRYHKIWTYWLRMVVLVAILIFSKSWVKCKTKTKLLLQIVIHEIQDGHCCSTEYQGKCHRTCTDWLKIVVLVAKCIYLWVRNMQRQKFFPYLYVNFHQTPCSYAKCKYCNPCRVTPVALFNHWKLQD